jgi:membrane protein YdbS with pleckstrin-like domain
VSQAEVVRVAEFDPKVQTYWFVQGAITHLVLVTAVIGVITLPLWLFGLGQWLSARRFAYTSAVLTQRAVHLKTGYWLRVEKTVPLEQIQDLATHSGPLLRAFGLSSVQLETAGGSPANGASDLMLHGLVDADGFRDAVLATRDALLDSRRGAPPAVAAAPPVEDAQAVLRDIRDSLARIEQQLGRAIDGSR